MATRLWHLLIPLSGFVGILSGPQAFADTPGAVEDSAAVAPVDTTAHMDFERLRELPGAFDQEYQKALREGRFRPAGKWGVIVRAPRFGMPILVPDLEPYPMPVLRPWGLFTMPQVDPYSVPGLSLPRLKTRPSPRGQLPVKDSGEAKGK
jgi:hypothetical protein